MKYNILVVLIILTLIVLCLAACQGPAKWKVAVEGESCTPATVIDRDWADTSHYDFWLLLKAEDGEIGMAVVNAYVYDSHQLGHVTCIIR